jgi:predicted nucleotide-binding protein (sugar kinase/HSP70/actin superfamily)
MSQTGGGCRATNYIGLSEKPWKMLVSQVYLLFHST